MVIAGWAGPAPLFGIGFYKSRVSRKKFETGFQRRTHESRWILVALAGWLIPIVRSSDSVHGRSHGREHFGNRHFPGGNSGGLNKASSSSKRLEALRSIERAKLGRGGKLEVCCFP